MGVKGVGETGTIASTAAVMNAVVDALSPFGVTDIEMPATPERVWRRFRRHSDDSRQVRVRGRGSVDEAIRLLGREDAKLLAGGHSLLPLMKLRFARPALLVDIGRLERSRTSETEGEASRSARSPGTTISPRARSCQEHCPIVATPPA